MRIATILPTKHLWLGDGSPYHLCLAHQAKKSLAYAFFFRKQVRDGKYVILDNGAAEYGVPMSIDELLPVAEMIGCQELVLPDVVGNGNATLHLSWEAYRKLHDVKELRCMAVPHGRTTKEWTNCAKEMSSWGVDTLGISKFIVPSIYTSRLYAIEDIQEIVWDSDMADTHLLGYTGVRGEVQDIERLFPDRVRGIDSSLPTLYAQIGQELKDERPDVKLNLDVEVDEELLKRNIKRWKELCQVSR